MKNRSFTDAAARSVELILAIGGILAMAAGCAAGPATSGGTASLDESSGVQGRDLGRGGATSGGVSSLAPEGNAADYSVYDARQTGR